MALLFVFSSAAIWRIWADDGEYDTYHYDWGCEDWESLEAIERLSGFPPANAVAIGIDDRHGSLRAGQINWYRVSIPSPTGSGAIGVTFRNINFPAGAHEGLRPNFTVFTSFGHEILNRAPNTGASVGPYIIASHATTVYIRVAMGSDRRNATGDYFFYFPRDLFPIQPSPSPSPPRPSPTPTPPPQIQNTRIEFSPFFPAIRYGIVVPDRPTFPTVIAIGAYVRTGTYVGWNEHRDWVTWHVYPSDIELVFPDQTASWNPYPNTTFIQSFISIQAPVGWRGEVSVTISTGDGESATTSINIVSYIPVIITDAAQLADIGGPDSTDRMFRLDGNITIDDPNWRPIEDFRGIFDGAGYVITFAASATRQGHFATAGVFGDINRGTVVIRNLGVRTSGTVAVSAVAHQNKNSRAFSGGIIGVVNGGDVTIENSFFEGRVVAESNYSSSSVEYNINNVFKQALKGIGSHQGISIAPWLFPVASVLENILSGAGTHAYAGGLIGFIASSANVRIINSHASGSVVSNAQSSFSFGGVRFESYAGGFVGTVNSPAQLTINNSYAINNVSARTYTRFMGLSNFDTYAGSLVGHNSGRLISHGNYRVSTQTLFASVGGTTNHNGTGALSYTNIRNRINSRSSASRVIEQASAGSQVLAPATFFVGDFVSEAGTNTPIILGIDMPLSAIGNVYVNGKLLSQGTHFTVASGSTRVNLLPSFLDTLEGGFHTVNVDFDGEITVEEHFFVIESSDEDVPPVGRLYLNDILAYTTGGLTIEYYQLNELHDNLQSFRLELLDGRIIENKNFNPNVSNVIYGSITIQNTQTPLTIELRQGTATGRVLSTAITPATNMRSDTSVDFLFESLEDETFSLVFSQPGHTSFIITNVVIPADADVVNLNENPRFPQILPLHPGDINSDGQVNISDLNILLQNWMGDYTSANFTGSGQINITDLNLLLQNWMAESVVVDAGGG